MSHFHTGFLPSVPDKVWKSDWRIGLEEKLRTPLPKYWKAEDVAPRPPKPEKMPRVAKVKEPKVKKERPPVVVEERRLCPGCGNKLNQQNRRGRCRKCVSRRKDGGYEVKLTHPPRQKKIQRTKFCSRCGKGLNANNRIGKCKACCPNQRLIKAQDRPKCSGCGRLMNRDNKYGMCRSCSRSPYNKAHRQKIAERRRAEV